MAATQPRLSQGVKHQESLDDSFWPNGELQTMLKDGCGS